METKKSTLSILNEELNLATNKFIFITDREGKILLFNSLFMQICNIANIDTELLRGEVNVKKIFIPSDISFDDIFNTLNNEHYWEGEMAFILSYDKKILTQVKAYLLKINSKGFNYIFNFDLEDYRQIEEDTITDLTKYKKLDLSPMLMGFSDELLKKSNNEKEIIISNLSHEFRTPLTSIIGFTETIKSDPYIDLNTRNEFLSIILEESKKLTAIINEMIDLLDFERGTLHMTKTIENLNALIKNYVSIFTPTLSENEIRVVLELPENDVLVEINKDKFEQLIAYLIDNAFKNIKSKGKITIRLEDNPDTYTLEFIDSGKPIPKESYDDIFKRYYRINDPNLKLNNLGFGLAICKAIVEAHNGKITVESDESFGNKFKLVFSKVVK